MRSGLIRAVLAAAACLAVSLSTAAARHDAKRPGADIRAAEAWAFWGSAKPDPTFPKPRPKETLHVSGSPVTYKAAQLDDSFLALDWFPDEHPPMPPIVASGRNSGRKPAVAACGLCHGPDGQGDAVSAALAGLPEAYILEQLEAFRSGTRGSPASVEPTGAIMPRETRHLSNADMQLAAAYFSGLAFKPQTRVIETDTAPKVAIRYFSLIAVANGGEEPIGERIVEVTSPDFAYDPGAGNNIAYVPRGSLQHGKVLVTQGHGKAQACVACHGADLRGLGPIPPLAGRSPTDIVREMILFRIDGRRNVQALPMRHQALHLSVREMIAAAAYIASLQPSRSSLVAGLGRNR